MKQLQGTATAEIGLDIEDCFALLADLEAYPEWCGEIVREVGSLECDDHGQPTRARAQLHVAHGPLVKDFDLLLAVHTQRPQLVQLTRVPHTASEAETFEVLWRLQRGADATRIALELRANLPVPRMVPLGGAGDAVAAALVEAARRRLA